jgi:protease-4
MADGAILDLPSLGLSTLYFGKAMELAGIRSSVVRVGDFKGAVEPFMLPEMSPHLREHYRAMLETMNDALVTRIANGRELDPTRVRRFQADRFFTSRAAADAGLVDEVVALGGAHARVEAQLGGRVSWIEGKKKDAEPTSFFEIMNQMFGGEADSSEEEPVVAVLHLAGMIVDGADEEPATLVSGPTVRAIEEIREDRNVRGVVVRVNSPGGSATASEAIRSALARLAAEKPVVVSMGEVAGSGGYWITCFGRPVFAEPATITGSIGVLALKLDAGLLLDRIGVRWDSVALDESATAFAPNRAWTKAESERLQGYCDEVYSKFVALVAASRKLDAAKVDSIGGGRVWSGVQAKENGLVDAVGGLEDALAALRKEASIPETVPVVHRPKPLSIFEVLEKVFGGGEEEVLLRAAAPLEALRAAGFDLRAPMRLALEGLRAPGPRVLLLEPTSFVIR